MRFGYVIIGFKQKPRQKAMNELTRQVKKHQLNTIGIDGAFDAECTEYSNLRTVIRVRRDIGAVYKRVVLERITEGWWVARFYKGVGGNVVKKTFKEGSIDEVMTYAVSGVLHNTSLN